MIFNKFPRKIFSIAIVGIIILSIFIFFNERTSNKVEAGPINEHNVWGFAWSGEDDNGDNVADSMIGWINFNNCRIHNPGPPESLTDCKPTKYGVRIDTNTGMFSGYAWASTGPDASGNPTGVGWIQFNPSGPYPAGPNYSVCVDLPSASGQPCEDLNDYEVAGWARAYRAVNPEGQTLGGWDGWIKFRGTTQDGNNYGVYIDTATTPASFRGYAWGGDDSLSEAVVGRIKFSGITQDGNDYGVYTNLGATVSTPPTVVANGVTGDFCAQSPTGNARFNWTYTPGSGGAQNQYHLQVYDVSIDPDNSPSTVDITSLPGNSSSFSNVNVKTAPGANELSYNAEYCWRVEVWDGDGNKSEWSLPTCLGGGELIDAGSLLGTRFRTPRFPYPSVDFHWDPDPVVESQVVQFCSVQEVININIDNPPVGPGPEDYSYNESCPIDPTKVTKCYNDLSGNGDGALCSIWSWLIPDPANDFQYGFGSGSTAKNPYGKFSVGALVSPQNVTLRVGEDNGQSGLYSCRFTKSLTGGGLPLPKWREISPF